MNERAIEVKTVQGVGVVDSACAADPGSCAAAQLEPRAEVSVRVGTLADIAFIDELQKPRTNEVGWMPRMQLEEYVERGEVLIAEGIEGSRDRGIERSGDVVDSVLEGGGARLGYIIGRDRYFKREDVGVIYQLCVVPGQRRGLVGAMLVKAMFDGAAYGCRLFCCWCAQDLEANRFWESVGFVPLAFRTGSRKKERVHIFWQRRVRSGDVATDWWFPSQTGSGAIREDRLVLPIPPGTHWSDAKPMVLPGLERERDALPAAEGALEAEAGVKKRKRAAVVSAVKPDWAPKGGLWFADKPPAHVKAAEEAEALKEAEELKNSEPKAKLKASEAKAKNNPKLVAAARELRDRYLEEVNSPAGERLLVKTAGKWDVSRVVEEDGVGVPGGGAGAVKDGVVGLAQTGIEGEDSAVAAREWAGLLEAA